MEQSQKSSVRRFVSLLAGRSPFNAYREGHLLIVFRLYFDGSAIDEPAAPHSACRHQMTLAAFAANDSVWADFEAGWLELLKEHPLHPAYMHMNEAMQLRGEFASQKGWTLDAARLLVISLAQYAGRFKGLLSSAAVRLIFDTLPFKVIVTC